MNATMTTLESRQAHPPQQVVHVEPTPVRRVNTIDRIALHLGFALIRWGRRPHRLESRERRATVREQLIAREARERAVQRSMLLTLPPR